MNDDDPFAPAQTSAWRHLQFPGLAVLALSVTALGMLGFAQYYRSIGKVVPALDLLYLSLQLFGLESGSVQGHVPWLLQISRFSAPVITGVALAKALIGIFKAELRALRLSKSKGHVVVCGMGKKASALVRDFRRERKRVVVIDTSAENRLLRSCGDSGVYSICDDATCYGSLKAARVSWAEHVFITTSNDSTNIEIAAKIIKLVRAAKKRITCHVHLVDRQTAELFKKNRIFKDASDNVDMKVFNLYDNAARLLWREHLLVRGPLDAADTRRMRVVIGGLGQMGEAVLLRLARSALFANGRKLAVTVIDRETSRRQACLFEQYPMLPKLCDIDFIEAELDSPETACRIARILSDPDQIGTLILCLDSDYANFAIALRIAPHLATGDFQILIRLSHAAGLCELLRTEQSESALARQINGFGLVETCCTKEMVLTGDLHRFARSLHACYVRTQLEAGTPATAPALQPWGLLLEGFRESNCEQAEHMEIKLRAFGYSASLPGGSLPHAFDAAQTETLARMEHARWCAERGLAGWTYAPGPKDAEHRTSPHLVPWDQLDASIKKIDIDFVRALPRILAEREEQAVEPRSSLFPQTSR